MFYPLRGNPCDLVANVLDCDIVISEFELQSCNNVHFWTNTLGKGMNSPPYYPSNGLNSITTVLQ